MRWLIDEIASVWLLSSWIILKMLENKSRISREKEKFKRERGFGKLKGRFVVGGAVEGLGLRMIKKIKWYLFR